MHFIATGCRTTMSNATAPSPLQGWVSQLFYVIIVSLPEQHSVVIVIKAFDYSNVYFTFITCVNI